MDIRGCLMIPPFNLTFWDLHSIYVHMLYGSVLVGGLAQQLCVNNINRDPKKLL